MNEQNFEYLRNQLRNTGFGEEQNRELREKMQMQVPDFRILAHAQFGEDRVEAALHFKKSEQSENYFFNRYSAQLKNSLGDESFSQTFRIGRENNITLKEGYNLLKGRAILKEMTPKEGEKYNAWLQLNFKETDDLGEFKLRQFHPNYGFDLRSTLAKYPIRELEHAESAQALVRSLERGNRQEVTMMLDGREQKVFIEASPQFKSLDVFIAEGLRVKVQREKLKPYEKQSVGGKTNEKMKEGQAVSEKKTEVERVTPGSSEKNQLKEAPENSGKKQALKAGDTEEGTEKSAKQSRTNRQSVS